jgi:RNA polymerase-binding transcription factor DksA
MKKKDIDFFKKYLENRLQELLSQADDTVSGMTITNENFPDPTDRASLEADRNFLLWDLRVVRRGNLGQTAQGTAGDHPVHRVQSQRGSPGESAWNLGLSPP